MPEKVLLIEEGVFGVSCRYTRQKARRVKLKDRRRFYSAKSAVKAGYGPCGTCRSIVAGMSGASSSGGRSTSGERAARQVATCCANPPTREVTCRTSAACGAFTETMLRVPGAEKVQKVRFGTGRILVEAPLG